MPDDNDTKQSREDFQEARRALVDKVVAEHPGLTHQDFNDVKIKDFDDHAKGLAEQRRGQDREAGARALGISVEEFDALKPKQEAPPAEGESTPQSRTANLPQGKSSTTPPPPKKSGEAGTGEQGPKWGVDLIEDAANDFLANSGFLKRG